MKDVSSQFLATVAKPHRVATQVICKVPGGDSVGLAIDACSVTAYSGTGRRKSAEVVFAPVDGQDIYEMVATPGALFNINHGFRYTANSSELVPVFTGEAASGASPLEDGSVSMSLTDLWGKVDRCRFLNPYHPAAATRAQTIANAIEDPDALGPLPEDITAVGGSTNGKSVWDRDRSQAIKDLATDGGLEAYIDSDGDQGLVVVRAVPTLNPSNTVWTIRSGDGGTLIGGSRTRPLDRLYNTVVVVPADDTQTWTRQISAVTNPNHPRHPDKIGVVPYFWSSPTITSATRAKSAADALLSRVLGSTETIAVDAVANPALEPGDVITIIKSGPVGQQVTAVHIIDGWNLDCVAGKMSFDTRSSTGDLEEAA